MAREKGMACRRLYVELAKRSPVKLTAAEVVEFLRVMSEVIADHVAPQNVIRIPQLATFRIRFNQAQPERTKRIGSGKEFLVPAKPITPVLKATVAHELQQVVRNKQGDGKKKKKTKKNMRAKNPTVAHDEASETQRDSSDDLN